MSVPGNDGINKIPGNVGVNKALNSVGEAGEWIWENGTKTILPGILGGIGGWLVSVGTGKGLVQGVTSGALYSYILSPGGTYIYQQPTEGEGSISYKARGFWYGAGVIANIAVPIFATYYASDTLLAGATKVLPSFVGNWIQPTSTEYTVIRGVLVNVAPAVTQWIIKGCRKEDPRKNNIRLH